MSERIQGVLSKTLILIFMLYPFVTLRIFHMFGCREFIEGTADGKLHTEVRHRYDYSIDCNSPTFHSFTLQAYTMVAVYPVGLPLLVVYIFWKNKERLGQSALKPAAGGRPAKKHNNWHIQFHGGMVIDRHSILWYEITSRTCSGLRSSSSCASLGSPVF